MTETHSTDANIKSEAEIHDTTADDDTISQTSQDNHVQNSSSIVLELDTTKGEIHELVIVEEDGTTSTTSQNNHDTPEIIINNSGTNTELDASTSEDNTSKTREFDKLIQLYNQAEELAETKSLRRVERLRKRAMKLVQDLFDPLVEKAQTLAQKPLNIAYMAAMYYVGFEEEYRDILLSDIGLTSEDYFNWVKSPFSIQDNVLTSFESKFGFDLCYLDPIDRDLNDGKALEKAVAYSIYCRAELFKIIGMTPTVKQLIPGSQNDDEVTLADAKELLKYKFPEKDAVDLISNGHKETYIYVNGEKAPYADVFFKTRNGNIIGLQCKDVKNPKDFGPVDLHDECVKSFKNTDNNCKELAIVLPNATELNTNAKDDKKKKELINWYNSGKVYLGNGCINSTIWRKK